MPLTVSVVGVLTVTLAEADVSAWPSTFALIVLRPAMLLVKVAANVPSPWLVTLLNVPLPVGRTKRTVCSSPISRVPWASLTVKVMVLDVPAAMVAGTTVTMDWDRSV
jgi:hypothetical protein